MSLDEVLIAAVSFTFSGLLLLAYALSRLRERLARLEQKLEDRS